MNDYQKYIILSWYIKVRDYESENNIKHLNIKYIKNQFYLGYFRI